MNAIISKGNLIFREVQGDSNRREWRRLVDDNISKFVQFRMQVSQGNGNVLDRMPFRH